MVFVWNKKLTVLRIITVNYEDPDIMKLKFIIFDLFMKSDDFSQIPSYEDDLHWNPDYPIEIYAL